MVDKIPQLTLLNKEQTEKAINMLKFYKFVYLCNICGNLYGSDKHEKGLICPVCEKELIKKKREEK